MVSANTVRHVPQLPALARGSVGAVGVGLDAALGGAVTQTLQ